MPFQRRKKDKSVTKKISQFTIISPLAIVALNILILGFLWLILPPRITMPRWTLLFIIGIALNALLGLGAFFTYYLRDQSDKFVCPVFSAPLGKGQGFLNIVPPIVKDGKMLEPEYTLRAVGGFEAMYVYGVGKVITAYPTKYEVHHPGGGIVCYCWLRSRKIDQVAQNVRDWLINVGASKGIFVDGDTEIWFSRRVFDVGQSTPDSEEIRWEDLVDELNAEIFRLKGLGGELKYQVESHVMGASLQAAKRRPADEDFRNKYNKPPETVEERASRGYEEEEQKKRERERGSNW